ncbi:hypothetical protein L6164_004463 [Bauhinia variegata]|uniref:Uncharacterized protein n=1 Tax=Bauhinia variegata TaxID=167791 RepID=A0ACB9Q4M5_BAUVA|nr:hypothetical protein L6164_004463 [Bauhinia variegata]
MSETESSSVGCCAVDHNRRPHSASQPGWRAIEHLLLQHGEVGLEHFHLLCKLGSGDIGKVFLCEIKNKNNNPFKTQLVPKRYYAMKVVDNESLREKNKLKRAETEKQVLSMLDHPFLPTLYAKFDAHQHSCLIMDYCHGGDLFKLQQRQSGFHFSISTAKFYAAEVLLALEYLHMKGIIYRDLKPENVLIQEDGHIMLSDFDLSLHCEVHPKLVESLVTSKRLKKPTLCCEEPKEHMKRKNKKMGAVAEGMLSARGAQKVNIEMSAEPITARSESFVGTHEYLAPEIILGFGHGSAVDWWAFGVFLYELLYGFTPFRDKNNKETLKNIIEQSLSFPRTQFKDRKDSEEIREAQDLIRKLLVRNPEKRLGYTRGSCEIKKHEFFEGVNWALIRSVKPPIVPRDLDQDTNKIPFSSRKQIVKKKATFEAPQQIDYF